MAAELLHHRNGSRFARHAKGASWKKDAFTKESDPILLDWGETTPDNFSQIELDCGPRNVGAPILFMTAGRGKPDRRRPRL
jgi:hypothetical protein